MIARDPDPIATALQRRKRHAADIGHARRPAAVVKAIAECDDEPRRIPLDETRQSAERRRRIVRRQEHAARREGRAFFEMQIGDDE